MHKEQLFNRDIIYIIHGNKAFTSIQERLAEYKKACGKKKRILMKLEHYVPISGIKLVFGMQIHVDSIKGDFKEMFNQLKVMKAKPGIQRYYFQLFVPNSIFTAPRVETTNKQGRWLPPFNPVLPNSYHNKGIGDKLFNQYTPDPSKFLFFKDHVKKSATQYRKYGDQRTNGSTNIIVHSIDNMVVNNNVQYTFPPFYNMPQSYVRESFSYFPFASPYLPLVYPNPIYESVQRLETIFEPPVIDSSDTLLAGFLEKATPNLKRVLDKSTLVSTIWDYYKNLEIELFKRGSGKPKMANYAASLIAVSLISNKKSLITYKEVKPHYQGLPLYNMIQELNKEYPVLTSTKISELDKNSWFGVLWAHTNCTPQLEVLTQFSIYYKFSGDVGCEQIGMVCKQLKECAFWGEILTHKEIVEMIKREEDRLKESNIISME